MERHEKIQIAYRIWENSLRFSDEYFPNRKQGGEYIMEAFPSLFREALREMKGFFNQEELSLIVDIENGHQPTPQIAHNKGIIRSVLDGIEMDRLDEKWGVDKGEMLKKLKSLTFFQCAVLEIWAAGFWYGANRPNKQSEEDLKNHINILLLEE